MKMKRLTLVFCCLAAYVLSFGQVNYQTLQRSYSAAATVNVSAIQYKWDPLLRHLEMPAPGSESYRAFLAARKAEIAQLYASKTASAKSLTATLPPPQMGKNFQGNTTFEGVPNDNNLAISDSGILISAINSNVYIYDAINDSLLTNFSLAAMAAPLNLPASKFDPKCIFDPKQDRFILIFLSGSTDTTNNIIVAFSQSNDPTANWNLYALEGNPRNNGSWSDYPIVAITNEELFISVNSVLTGVSWQNGFVESMVWQIKKADGYNGDTLSSKLWFDIKYNNKTVRNLCPVKGGSTTYGPNMYLLSNRNFDASNDTIFIFEITDVIDSTNATITLDVRKSSQAYGLAGNARQPLNTWFDTNDSRVLDAFIENDKIHFVGNSIDTANGSTAVYYGTVSNASTTKVVDGWVIGDTVLNFGYPGIAYAGLGSGDDDAVIVFSHCAPNVYPGTSAIYTDGNGQVSPVITVKSGVNYVNVIVGTVERWGDYSGAQRKFNEPGKVWVGSSWARSNRTFGTWIAEISEGFPVSAPQALEEAPEPVVYPVPASERFNIQFLAPETMSMEFILLDAQGRQVQYLMREKVKKGENDFSFSTEMLSDGVYFLTILSEGKFNLTEKVVISR